MSEPIDHKAARIALLLTDCDGVLTDGGIYYSAQGEQLKKFNIRDGMGVERLRNLVGVETGIVSGENSLALRERAEKLGITECHLGIKHKAEVVCELAARLDLDLGAIAYIGDDVNDLEVFALVGLSACPADAMAAVKSHVDIICHLSGGQGAFREFAELILDAHRRCA